MNPHFFSFLVVLQGSLHLEDIRTALQPGWQLEFVVQVWLLLQDVWWWCALTQPELQQPAVRSASLKREVHLALAASLLL